MGDPSKCSCGLHAPSRDFELATPPVDRRFFNGRATGDVSKQRQSVEAFLAYAYPYLVPSSAFPNFGWLHLRGVMAEAEPLAEMDGEHYDPFVVSLCEPKPGGLLSLC